MLVIADPGGRTKGSLAPPPQMTRQTVAYETVDLALCNTRIAIAEVLRPAVEVPIQIRNQCRYGHRAPPWASHVPQQSDVPEPEPSWRGSHSDSVVAARAGPDHTETCIPESRSSVPTPSVARPVSWLDSVRAPSVVPTSLQSNPSTGDSGAGPVSPDRRRTAPVRLRPIGPDPLGHGRSDQTSAGRYSLTMVRSPRPAESRSGSAWAVPRPGCRSLAR